MIVSAQVVDSVSCCNVVSAERVDRVPQSTIISALRADRYDSTANLSMQRADRAQNVRGVSKVVPDSVQAITVPAAIAAAVAAGTEIYPDVLWKVWVDGTHLEHVSASISFGVNSGWQGNVELIGDQADDFGDDVPIRIEIQDGLGGQIITPKLYATERQGTDELSDSGPSSSWTLMDETTAKAGRDNVSFPTFRGSTSKEIVASLATAAGIKVKGVIDFPVPDEDVKQSKINDAVQRIAAASAQEWHVRETGEMELVEWGKYSGELVVDWSRITRHCTPRSRFSKINIGKRSAVQANSDNQQSDFKFPFDEIGFKTFALPNPLSGVIIGDLSKFGYLDAIGVWNGDPGRGGKLIKYLAIAGGPFTNTNAVANGAYPATHISCYVMPPGGIEAFLQGFAPGEIQATMRVTGTPPNNITATPTPIDPEFLHAYDSGRPINAAPDWIDSIFPSRQWAVDRAPKFLQMKNKGWRTLDMNSALDVSPRLFQSFQRYGKTWRVDKITFTDGLESAPETNLNLVVME